MTFKRKYRSLCSHFRYQYQVIPTDKNKWLIKKLKSWTSRNNHIKFYTVDLMQQFSEQFHSTLTDSSQRSDTKTSQPLEISTEQYLCHCWIDYTHIWRQFFVEAGCLHVAASPLRFLISLKGFYSSDPPSKWKQALTNNNRCFCCSGRHTARR